MLSSYEQHLKNKMEGFEGVCIRCGACCGAFGEAPCSQLRKDKEGKYHCATYENRIGLQKTVKGRDFHCVPIRNILSQNWDNDWRCAYKKQLGLRIPE